MYNNQMMKQILITISSIGILLSAGAVSRTEEKKDAVTPVPGNHPIHSFAIPADIGIVRDRCEGSGPVSFILIRREGTEDGRINYAKTIHGLAARTPLTTMSYAVILLRPDMDERKDLEENGKLAVRTIDAGLSLAAERTALLQKIGRYALVIKRMKEIVETIEREGLSKELRMLVSKSEDLRGNLLSVDEYARFLIRLAKKAGISLKDFKQVSLFNASLRLEKRIEPAKAAYENEQLMDSMKPFLDAKDRVKLKEAQLAFKNGELSRNAYFLQIRSLAKKTGISFARYPYLADYCTYIQATADLDRVKLREECRQIRERLEQAFLSRQTASQGERVRALKDLHIFFHLLSLTASRKEYEYFTQHRDAFAPARLQGFLMAQEEKLLDKPGLSEEDVMAITMMDHSLEQIRGLCALLSDVESFLNSSFAREDAAFGAVIENLRHEGVSVGIVILDEPSLETMRSDLKKRGVPHIIVSPAAGEPKREDLFPQTMIKKGR